MLENMPAVDYMTGQVEVAPSTKKVHWQVFIVFHSPNKFEQVRKKLPGAHIEKAWGTAAENKAYCNKVTSRDPRNISVERDTMPAIQVGSMWTMLEEPEPRNLDWWAYPY